MKDVIDAAYQLQRALENNGSLSQVAKIINHEDQFDLKVDSLVALFQEVTYQRVLQECFNGDEG